MHVRLAEDRDLESSNAIYNQAVGQRFSTAHTAQVTRVWREAWFRAHPPGRYPVFVAEEKDGVAGWVSLGPYRSGRQALDHVAEVSYYVEREMQRRGIGSTLLAHAISEAPDRGLSVLVAILLDKNAASLALLRKFGFEQWGCMPGIARIDGGYADHLYYGLKLPE